jgi:hypothetical protein
MKPRFLAIATLALALPAQADIWLCVAADGKQVTRIQDRPCDKGFNTKSHIVDAQRRSTPRTAAKPDGEPAVGRTPIEIGLQRNKTVICNLLDTEKAEALAQISGSATPPPGEDPKDNLAKIEKQRSRVGCDAG